MPVLAAAEPCPLVRSLLADLGIAEGGVDLTIDPDDEMLGFLLGSSQGDRDRALWGYFQSGASIASSMGQVLEWRFGAAEKVGRLLDFASGYGRVTRFLRRRIAAERIWVSDVYAEGVRFQARRFGVHGIVSTLLPEDFPGAVASSAAEGGGGGGFDAILVTSLFTHLPEERFVGWLRVLMGLLTPGGVLAFSVHDEALLPLGERMPEGGLLFQEISESDSLATHDYGSTWVSEAFVRSALERAAAAAASSSSSAGRPAGSLLRLRRGLCNYQDLYVAVPEPAADFSRLAYRGEPRLFVERCAVAGGGDRLELRGWAAATGAGSIEAVEVLLDDQLLARLPVDHDRPEVAALLGEPRLRRSGWGGACRLPAAASRAQSVLRLRLVDDLGRLHPEAASTLEAALHASTRLEVTVVERALRGAEEETARQAAEAAALRARIAAMEASRFWKARNAWFRLKARAGVGEPMGEP